MVNFRRIPLVYKLQLILHKVFESMQVGTLEHGTTISVSYVSDDRERLDIFSTVFG